MAFLIIIIIIIIILFYYTCFLFVFNSLIAFLFILIVLSFNCLMEHFIDVDFIFNIQLIETFANN